MRAAIFAVAASLLAGCVINVNESNLNSFTRDRLAASQVDEYNMRQVDNINVVQIAAIQGHYCQDHATQTAKANPGLAERDLQIQAYNLGANGFVVLQCELVKTPRTGCFTQAICDGLAVNDRHREDTQPMQQGDIFPADVIADKGVR